MNGLRLLAFMPLCALYPLCIRGEFSNARPGDGYPGRLAPYPSTLELRKKMARFRLSAGWFHRNPLPPNTNGWLVADCGASDSLPYLLFSPRRVNYPVPMVIYFGGTGEHGTNLVRQFNQSVVFEKVTSSDFQRRNPCYVFAPMLPEGGQIRHALPVGTSALSDLTCDAMYAVIASLKRPPVDTNRLYLTGLSWGGVAAFELSCGYSGRFAAAVPVSCIQTPLRIPAAKPGNYWMFHNESSYRSEGSQWAIREMDRIVSAGGGDFRRSTFPDRGHDAWSKAWREDAVWDWMFSKRANGKTVPSAALLPNAVCTASVPGADDAHGPERAADGLDATCYISKEPMSRGDWWMAEFAAPIMGRVSVLTGTREGRGRLTSGFVEVSSDGRNWTRAGKVQRRTGIAAFDADGIRFLRVRPEPPRPEVLTLREVRIGGE